MHGADYQTGLPFGSDYYRMGSNWHTVILRLCLSSFVKIGLLVHMRLGISINHL